MMAMDLTFYDWLTEIRFFSLDDQLIGIGNTDLQLIAIKILKMQLIAIALLKMQLISPG